MAAAASKAGIKGVADIMLGLEWTELYADRAITKLHTSTMGSTSFKGSGGKRKSETRYQEPGGPPVRKCEKDNLGLRGRLLSRERVSA